MLLSAPKFPLARLTLALGGELTVKKSGEGLCPKRILFNGEVLEERKISASAMMAGGELVFEM